MTTPPLRKVVPADQLQGDDEEDTALLPENAQLLESRLAFLRSQVIPSLE